METFSASSADALEAAVVRANEAGILVIAPSGSSWATRTSAAHVRVSGRGRRDHCSQDGDDRGPAGRGPPGKDRLGTHQPPGAMLFVDDGTAHGPLSPNHEKPEVKEPEGRDPTVPDPDPQRVTKPVTYVGLAAGAAVSLALVIAAAGLARRRSS